MMLRRRQLMLRPRDGVTFSFDPGAPCLDFATTGGTDWRSVFETLNTPGDLDAWLRELLQVADTVPASAADLDAAIDLRQAIWHCADARIEGRPLPSDAVELINRTAAGQLLTERIDGAGHRALATPVTPAQVLATLARDAVALFGGPPGRIRRCEGVNCALVFADTSRPGRRRWCSMERCGNRAKVRAFRDQHKEHTEHKEREQA